MAYKYLKSENVNPNDVWLEKNTTSTLEQIKFIKDSLIQKKKVKNLIIVSDSYHLTRVKEICKFYNIKTKVAASDLQLSFSGKIYNKLRESIALLVFWFFAL